jgi:hypothetical protein
VTRCPACLGDGSLDFTESDAMIAETWTDDEIVQAVARGMVWPLGVVQCEECGGSGEVEDERAKDLAAGAQALADQIAARMRDRAI